MKAWRLDKSLAMRSTEHNTIPHAAPAHPYRRFLLFAVRRMAVGGLADAHAAHAIFTGFGRGYRRPLILLRASMAELARVSTVQLMVALCCCARMTRDEAMLLDLIAERPLRPSRAHVAMRDLLHAHSCLGAVNNAEVAANAFADLGMPLSG